MKSVVRSNVSSSFLFRLTALLDDTILCISSSALQDEPICATYALMRYIEFFLHSARFVFPDEEDETEKTIFPDAKEEVAETEFRTRDLIHDLEN